MPLIQNVLKPLAKSVLIPLGLTASATDATIHKKMFVSGTTTLIISNEEMNIMKIAKSLEESGLLINSISKAIKNEAEEQNGGFLGMLLGTLGTSLLGNLLTGKGTSRAGEGTVRAGQDFHCGFSDSQILKHKSIVKMNLNLMVFIQEIIYKK